MNPAAAGVAFFALGVTAFGSALLLLFNPRSSGVWWFAAFQASIATWLAAQGWGYATGDWAQMRPIVSGAVHMAPALFLGFAMGEAQKRPLAAAAAIALGVALLPLDLRSVDSRYAEPLLMAWNVGAWGLATVLLVRGMARRTRIANPGRRQRRAALLVLGLMVTVFPVGTLGGMLTGGAVHVYVMPLGMVWIQALLFVGVARLRFYDIEVRASRSGEIAAAAAEQERLAVVGELAASLAHEIRNPLTGVRSLAQRLAEDDVEEAKRRRYAGVILEEVGRVERLVANLLDIARRAPRQAPGDARTPLGPLFDDLALLVGGRAEKAGVRLVTDADEVEAPAAREPLAQALLNLLLNALAHAPEGTTVELRAREAADGVELTVRDQGPGVPPDERERIWEPFHSASGGTGLGLTVVRRLAREHEWRVEVDDAPGGGAEFRLTLPLSLGDDRSPAVPRLRTGMAEVRSASRTPARVRRTSSPLPRPGASWTGRSSPAPAGPDRKAAEGGAMATAGDDDLIEQQKAYYRVRAGEYDEWFLRQGRYDHGPEFRARWEREVAEVREALRRFRPAGRVLELACGTGWWTAQLIGFANELTAVDASAEVLALNAARVPDPRVRRVQADIFAYAPEGGYDVVFFSFWLSHVPPERFEAFWEMVRSALNPGGRVFFVDSLRSELSTASDHVLPGDGDIIAERKLNDGSRYSIYKIFYDPARLEARLEALGWRASVKATESFFLYGEVEAVGSSGSQGD